MHNEYKTVVARWWIALITCEHVFYYYIFCICYYPKHKHGATLMIRKCRRLLRARQMANSPFFFPTGPTRSALVLVAAGVPNRFIVGQNALNSSKLCERTGTGSISSVSLH